MSKFGYFLISLVYVIALVNAKAPPSTSGDQCNILLVVDTSKSINATNFENSVKPFLKDFVSDKALNTGGADGAQVALLLFSTLEKTELVIPFARRYSATQFQDYIDNNMVYESIKGNRTRTDRALMIANEEVFRDETMLKDGRNVIVLITDGKPWESKDKDSKKQVTPKSLAEAQKLKDKGVRIIGVGVGEKEKSWNFLNGVSSPGQVYTKEFDRFYSLKTHLVKTSCRQTDPFPPAFDCTCPDIQSAPYYLANGKTSTSISWEEPEPVCSSKSDNIISFTWDPSYNSPATFEAGIHNINYTFFSSANQTLSCTITFEVRGVNICSGRPYSSRQVCCCGEIHEKRDNYECCGFQYYSKAVHKCCKGYTLENINRNCPNGLCTCSEMRIPTRYVKSGDRTIVTWKTPAPSCIGRLVSRKPNVRSGQTFTPGIYIVDYLYRTLNQFDVTCTLRFQVKECVCTPPALQQGKIYEVEPGETTTHVTWNAPKPTCPVTRTVLLPKGTQSGQAFSIGQHTVVYSYTINNQFQLNCSVEFEVRGSLCMDKGYNNVAQTCCCGTIYDIISGYRCCGQSYYRVSTHRCCGSSVVRARWVPCPRQKRKAP